MKESRKNLLILCQQIAERRNATLEKDKPPILWRKIFKEFDITQAICRHLCATDEYFEALRRTILAQCRNVTGLEFYRKLPKSMSREFGLTRWRALELLGGFDLIIISGQKIYPSDTWTYVTFLQLEGLPCPLQGRVRFKSERMVTDLELECAGLSLDDFEEPFPIMYVDENGEKTFIE